MLLRRRLSIGALVFGLAGLLLSYNACKREDLQASSAGNPSGTGSGPGPRPRPLPAGMYQVQSALVAGGLGLEGLTTNPRPDNLEQTMVDPTVIKIVGTLLAETNADRALEVQLVPFYESIGSSLASGIGRGRTSETGDFSIAMTFTRPLVGGLKYRVVVLVTDVLPNRIAGSRVIQIGQPTTALSGGAVQTRCESYRNLFDNYLPNDLGLGGQSLAFDRLAPEPTLGELLHEVYWDQVTDMIALDNYNFATRRAGETLKTRWPGLSVFEFETNVSGLLCRVVEGGPLLARENCPAILGVELGPFRMVAAEIGQNFRNFSESQVEWNYRKNIAATQGVLQPLDEVAYCMWREGRAVLGLTVTGL